MTDLRCLYNGGVAYRTRINAALPPDERTEALAMLAAQAAAVIRARVADSSPREPVTLTEALRSLGGISAVVTDLIGPEPSPATNTHGMPTHGDWWRWRALSDATGQVRFQVQLLLEADSR